MSEPRQRKVVILGSTGSIGTSALQVARRIPERMQVVGLAANRNLPGLAQQAAEFGVREVGLGSTALREEFAAALPEANRHQGVEGLCELATLPEADLVLVSIIGVEGLRPALAAIEAGKDIAVASKEILVMAGEIVMAAARHQGVQVLPVDSEHNAIFQCLAGMEREQVARLILTASGGPFRETPSEDLEAVTPERALRHPTWEMGQKITIDSATLFNKGLEMIEARWLFDIEMARVEVVVHPQSIVHSLVETVDGSLLAQLSVTDMCFPIQYAVTWPERVEAAVERLDLARLARLDFEAPRTEDFPALDLAREAGRQGGTLPSVLNAANEVAVAAFLEGRLSFPGIWRLVGQVMETHAVGRGSTLEELLEADLWARVEAGRQLESGPVRVQTS
ncbi:MAG: 1-deoxy-D-xylulose-5-phosphate reductoisomerase [Verrucomicrobiota bacterium]